MSDLWRELVESIKQTPNGPIIVVMDKRGMLELKAPRYDPYKDIDVTLRDENISQPCLTRHRLVDAMPSSRPSRKQRRGFNRTGR